MDQSNTRIESESKEDEAIIPYELIEETLIRLPARSLVRFRCLSQSWLSFLTDAKFIHSHTIRTEAEGDEQKLVCFLPNTESLQIGNPETCIYFNDGEYDDIYSDAAQTISLPSAPNRKYYSIIGSHNGLICLMQKFESFLESYSLINPMTRELYQEFHNPDDSSPNIEDPYIKWGFGYDLSTQDYKVVRILACFSTPFYRTEVFSLKNNCWRIIDNDNQTPIPKLSRSDIGCQVGGFLHWRCLECEDGIFTFDLSTHKHGILHGPKDKEEDDTVAVTVFHGCLCVTKTSTGERFNIWIMKKYGVEESWTKLFQLMPLIYNCKLFQAIPICYANKGRLLLLKDTRRIFLYNIEDGSLRLCRVPNRCSYKSMIAYTETLASPSPTHISS